MFNLASDHSCYKLSTTVSGVVSCCKQRDARTCSQSLFVMLTVGRPASIDSVKFLFMVLKVWFVVLILSLMYGDFLTECADRNSQLYA